MVFVNLVVRWCTSTYRKKLIILRQNQLSIIVSLSSNSLIHLTTLKESLIGILKEDFKLKYCLENLITPNGNLNYAIPMISFCDIPMSEIKDHISKYGSYGIGLTREWGQRNNLNPVFYVDKNSAVGKGYYEAFYDLFLSTKRKISQLSKTEIKLVDVMRYMKNYEADLERDGDIQHNYRYADEKEWRYVPKEDETQIIFTKTNYLSRKHIVNNAASSLRLHFEPKDIKYIIIKHDNEITEFIDVLRKSKGKYSYDEVDRLTTRIITTEQILSDF